MSLHLCKFRFERAPIIAYFDNLYPDTDDITDGYCAHTVIADSVGDGMPPFAVEGRDGYGVEVITYAEDPTRLRSIMESRSHPNIHRAIRWDTWEAEKVDRLFPGKLCLFKTRLVPSVISDGQEVDLYTKRFGLVEDQRPGANPHRLLNRSNLYEQWAVRQINKEEGVTVEQIDHSRYHDRNFYMRSEDDQRALTFTSQELRLRGLLMVKDVEAFQKTVLRGVGKYRHFGYGMILLETKAKSIS